MACNNCKHFCPRNGIKLTSEEKYAADTRPEPKSFRDKLAWFYDPNRFRSSPPDYIDKLFDPIELDRRARGYGTCRRFPEAVNHYGDYHCAEFAE